MKPATTILGQEIQVFLLRQGHQLDTLAKQMAMTPVGLSNLIHGRRRFKDATLQRLSCTPIFIDGEFTLTRLRALRALDEYVTEELLLALFEEIKRQGLEHISPSMFDMIRRELMRLESVDADAMRQLKQYIASIGK